MGVDVEQPEMWKCKSREKTCLGKAFIESSFQRAVL